MKLNKRENFRQTVRNYENNVNISYISRLFVYLNRNCELQYQEIFRVEEYYVIIRELCQVNVGTKENE